MDLHKYGYAPKGFDPAVGQSGVAFPTTTSRMRPGPATPDQQHPAVEPLRGTCGGGWAVLHLLGKQGLRELALKSRAGALRIAEGGSRSRVARRVAPEASLVCAGDTGAPEGPDVRIVSDEAHRLGWSLQVQPARQGGPTNIHPTVAAGVADRADELLEVLRRPLRRPPAKRQADPDPQLAAIAASIDVDALDPATIDGLMQVAGFKGQGGPVELPEEMAESTPFSRHHQHRWSRFCSKPCSPRCSHPTGSPVAVCRWLRVGPGMGPRERAKGR